MTEVPDYAMLFVTGQITPEQQEDWDTIEKEKMDRNLARFLNKEETSE